MREVRTDGTTHAISFRNWRTKSKIWTSPLLVPIQKNPPRGGFLLNARPTGLEPATSSVTGRRSNQLSYGLKLVAGGYFNSNRNIIQFENTQSEVDLL